MSGAPIMNKFIIRDLDHAIAPAGTSGSTLHPALIGIALIIGAMTSV